MTPREDGCICIHSENIVKRKATKTRKAYHNKFKRRAFVCGCPVHAKGGFSDG